MIRSAFTLVLFSAALAGQTTGAFDPEPPSTPASTTSSATVPQQSSPTVDPSQRALRIGPNDTINLAVADLPELSRNFRVSSDGRLMLPMLKEKIPVTGKTTQEVEQAVSDALVREQILVSPVISVTVIESTSVPVTVLGAVRHPLTFQAIGNVHLLDAITRAEGIGPDAGPYILLTEPPRNGAQSLTRRIDIKELLDEANPELNVPLYGGEEIRVPTAGRIYVLGNVKRSGAFPIEDNGDASVMKIVAESDGLLPFASKEAYIYRKDPGASDRSEITINIHDILERKAPDIPLQANDILYVPDDRHRRLTVGIIERAAGFGVATASGLLIFH